MLVLHAEQGHCGEVRAGRLTADEQSIGAELVRRVLEQPASRSFTVVRSRGVRVLRCEAVVDAHDRDVAPVDDDLVELIHHLG